jgi:DNA (cytosine-5)-methyltransferase 1
MKVRSDAQSPVVRQISIGVRMRRVRLPLTAVDLFAGAGGTTQGLKDAGFQVLAAIENDSDAVDTYEANHGEVKLYSRDIQRVKAPALSRLLGGARIGLLTACPPCQGFSTLGLGDTSDKRNDLVMTVARFAEHLRPWAIVLENVPQLAADRRLRALRTRLEVKYEVRQYVIDAADFGVPQHRKRVIVLAVDRDLDPELPDDLTALLPDDFDTSMRSSWSALEVAESLTEADDPVHRARRSSDIVRRRIKAAPIGGGRVDLPPDLRLACHKRLKGTHATSIYGRIHPEKPSPTMTTRCTTPSCGRFIHPYQDRGITLREAALLQSFPLGYRFKGTHQSIERQIGNAVPVRLSRALAEIVKGVGERSRPEVLAA